MNEQDEDIKKLLGLPPYNTSSNICWNDGYFGKHLEQKYGKPLQELIDSFKERQG